MLCSYADFSYHCKRLHILQPNINRCLGIILLLNTEDRKVNKSHRCTETREHLQFEDEEINTGRNRPFSNRFNGGLDSSLCFMESLHGMGLSVVCLGNFISL